MRRPTWTHGRRGALTGASAAVVVCTGVAVAVAVCGGDGGEGYVAVGAAPGVSVVPVSPTGGVRLIPLDEEASGGARASGVRPGGEAASAPASGPGAVPIPAPVGTSPSTDAGADATGGTEAGGAPDAVEPEPEPEPDKSRPPQPSSPAPSPTASPGPAVLHVGGPVRAATARRWCERVTLPLHNSGGSAVRSGSVTFGTHVIDALGIDWSTLESTEPLPTPISPGARTQGSWTVCVDAWRVPWGMRVETRVVSVRWG